MAEDITLVAEPRTRFGKGGARAARREGRLPAVIYGNKMEPVSVTIDPKEIDKQLRSPGFFSHVFEINVEGKKHRVLARELQTDPVSGKPLHLDFLRFSARSTVTVDVAVVVQNEDVCPGVKHGGLINLPSHTLALLCRADSIPESIPVDIADLNIGDAIHIKDITLPAGVELGSIDPEATLVTIAAPKVAVEEEEVVEEEAAEGEAAEEAAPEPEEE